MSRQSRRARRAFTDEFKAEAVALVESSGKSVGRVAQDLDLTETALYARSQGSAPSPLSGDERGELKRLRDENRVLRMG